MKRAPLRRTPLRPGAKRLKRRTPLRPVNPERAAKKYERNFGAYAEVIRRQPCAVPGCRSRKSEPAHVKPRGMGGCGGAKRDLVPLCRRHHREQEGRTSAFQARYSLDLTALAASLWARYGDTSTLSPAPAGHLEALHARA